MIEYSRTYLICKRWGFVNSWGAFFIACPTQVLEGVVPHLFLPYFSKSHFDINLSSVIPYLSKSFDEVAVIVMWSNNLYSAINRMSLEGRFTLLINGRVCWCVADGVGPIACAGGLAIAITTIQRSVSTITARDYGIIPEESSSYSSGASFSSCVLKCTNWT